MTVTLPDRVLDMLGSVHRDRARAIVKCVEAVAGVNGRSRKPMELVAVAPGKALVVVGPARRLEELKWLQMVEIAPTRYLLVIPPGMPVEVMEVSILDLLDQMTESEARERAILENLRLLLGRQRRRQTLSKGEIIFVDPTALDG